MTALIPLSSSVQVPAVVQNASFSANSNITAITIDPSTGNIYVGGNFLTVNGVTRNNLAAFTRYGVLLSWNPGITYLSAGTYANCNALLWTSAGIVVGGLFTSINSTSRTGVAMVDTTGAVLTWAPNLTYGGSPGVCYALATDGTNIFVGGLFTTLYSGTSANGFAAITTSGAGSIVSGSNSLVTTGSSVNALAYDGSTYLYVGGNFSYVRKGSGSFETRNSLCRAATATWYADATWDAVLTASGSACPLVGSLTIDTSGNLYISGYFDKCLSTARMCFASVSGSTPTLNSWNPGTGSLTFGYAYSGLVFAVGTDVYWCQSYLATSSSLLGCMTSGGTAEAWNPGIGTSYINAMTYDPSNTTIVALWLGGIFTVVLSGTINADVRIGLAKVTTRATNPTRLCY
jgi:hypothetical protein